MILLFIHQAEKIKIDEAGNRYTDGSYNESVWDTYQSVADEITFIARCENNKYSVKEAKERFNLIPKNIDIVLLPDSNSSVKSYFDKQIQIETDKIFYNEIKKADAVIFRYAGRTSAIAYAKRLGKPYIVEVVGCTFDSLWNHSWKGKVLAIPEFFKMRKAIKNADNVLYVTQKFLQQRYPTNGKCIGCSDVRLENANEKDFADRLTEIDDHRGKLIIGTASGIGVKYKGQQYIIRAIANLKKRGIDCFEYQIAGHGDRSYLESVIKKCGAENEVKFVGSIPHEKIFDWYRSIDIYAQPSNVEGLPRALAEAMSCAVPCIGSRVGGIPELLPDEAIFEKKNMKQIEQILENLLSKDFRKQVAKKCFKRSLDYRAEILEKKRVDFMKEVFRI